MSVRRVMALVGVAGLLAGSGVASGAASGDDNGVAAKSASDIVLSSLSAINGVSTVHVFGYLVSGSKVTLDLHLVTDRGGEGTVSSNGLKFSLIVIGKTAYFKAARPFGRLLAAVRRRGTSPANGSACLGLASSRRWSS
jgi:hypothetical protein